MSEKFDNLKTMLAEIQDLQHTMYEMQWDQAVNLPPGGSMDRANALATLTKLYHTRLASDELGHLLDALSYEVEDLDPDSDEARIVQVVKRDHSIESKLSEKLVEEQSLASSAGLAAWYKARDAKDYSLFADALKRNVDVNRKIADALGYDNRPYDALLGRYEPGLTTAQLETIFSELKAAIVPILSKIAEKQDAVDNSCLYQPYDEATQISFALSVSKQFGYDLNRGRLDKSPHPFCTSFGTGDVRITTRVYPEHLGMALFSTMHETGHALYEQGIGASLYRTPLAHGASPGVHESQSRLWENLVGRSRACQDYLFPRLQKTFPSQLENIDVEGFYRAINKVTPSLNRVTSDEVTYNLHIILRFELENDMLADRVDIDKLDEVWVERMQHYFGVTPPDDKEGVLQDIHWSEAGQFAIFPGYTLGNIIGAQLFRQARKELPDLDSQISKGEFGTLLGWLQTKLYQHGRKFTPNELSRNITSEPIGTAAWITYIREKYSALYGL